MYFLYGMLSLIGCIVIGVLRTMHREKEDDEFFAFSVIKWVLAGWAMLGIFSIVDTLVNKDSGYTNMTALYMISIGFSLAVIVTNIVEIIAKANALKNKKIKEYKEEKKNNWE